MGTPTRMPLRSAGLSWHGLAGLGSQVPSLGSPPRSTPKTSAASAVSVVNGPIWSRLEANATSPQRLTWPYDGLNPVTPQKAAGCRMDPPVSEPRATGTSPAATAAALPPEEPPGTRDGSAGFLTGPKWHVSVEDPMANSSQFTLPTTTAPASCSRVTTVASKGERYSSSILDPQLVRPSLVQMLSLMATGTPAKGPADSPAMMRRSISAALAKADWSKTSRNALDVSA